MARNMLLSIGRWVLRPAAINFLGGISMNVNALGNNQTSYVTGANTGGSRTPASLWAQLGKSLNSGDLAGAQTAFAAIKQSYEQNHSTSGAGKPTGPLVTDVERLSQSLQAGNLGDAQTAFATLSQDAKNLGIGTEGNPADPGSSAAVAAGTVDVRA